MRRILDNIGEFTTDYYNNVNPLYCNIGEVFVHGNILIEPGNRDEYVERAEAYLKYIGAIERYGLWYFDGDIHINENSFLILDGKLTVMFGIIEGDFICDNRNLSSTFGLPIRCNNLILSNNNLISIDYLPDAYTYDISNNNIDFIYDDLFSTYATEIILSFNNLKKIPNIKSIGLSIFKCSNNLLSDLENLPNSNIIDVSRNDLQCISLDDKLLNNYISDCIDLSFNNLISLYGVPATRKLICKHNKLTCIKAINDTIEYHNGFNLDIRLFEDLNLKGNINLESIKNLKGVFYKINITNTKINYLDNLYPITIHTLYAENLKIEHNNMLEGSKIYDLKLYGNNDDQMDNVFIFLGTVKSIDYNNRPHKLFREVDFYNLYSNKFPGDGSIAEKEEYISNYYSEFLNFLYENKHSFKEKPEQTIRDNNFPEEFHDAIFKIGNSQKQINRFNL